MPPTPPPTSLDKARELAGWIAGQNPQAVKAAIRATTEGFGMDVDQAMVVESEWSSSLIGTYNSKEGMAAFFEKRNPVFREE